MDLSKKNWLRGVEAQPIADLRLHGKKRPANLPDLRIVDGEQIETIFTALFQRVASP